MADNEDLRSILGIPTPKVTPDNATLRAVAGIPSLGSESSTSPPSGVSRSTSMAAAMPAAYSPSTIPSVLFGG